MNIQNRSLILLNEMLIVIVIRMYYYSADVPLGMYTTIYTCLRLHICRSHEAALDRASAERSIHLKPEI
jgi:hypothetical protein